MHQPISMTIMVDEYEALIVENEVLKHLVCEMEATLRDYEERPETVYADILEVKREIFPLCKRMFRISSKFKKHLSKSESVEKLHNDILDMYNEVKCSVKRRGSDDTAARK